MTKLFSADNDLKINYSVEEFAEYHSTAKVISTEAVTDYLYAIKDKVNVLATSTFTKTDITMIDATANRFEVTRVLKRVHFTDLAPETIVIPERFNGSYPEYLKTLIDVSEESVKEVTQLLNNLKMAISSFLNEYAEDGILTIYGKSYAVASEKLITKNKGRVSSFFPTNKSNSSGRIKDVVRNNGDIEALLNNTKDLEGVINENKLKDIVKLSKEVSEMVDVLIEENSKNGILLKNDSAKKDLIEMIHVGALGVEFISYLYANTVYLYNALKSLTDKVLVVGNR